MLNFENVHCLGCGHSVGYIPELGELAAIEEVGGETWQIKISGIEDQRYHQCLRYKQDNACNWMVHSADKNELCRSCRMTSIIPDLSILGNREAWHLLEMAKRRWLYGIAYLGLPIIDRIIDPQAGMTFEFLADTHEEVITTGHSDGIITINVIEADPVERERMRTNLSEPYRTLLGHMRHESGHFYWDRLVGQSKHLSHVRALFGDERQDYDAARYHYYNGGGTKDWAGNFVSDYAAMHPWEDWAETWAHYLHLVDSVEIASYLGLSLYVMPSGSQKPKMSLSILQKPLQEFDDLLNSWFPLTYATNCLNRSIGHTDWYPFTLGPGAIEKLRLVHTIVREIRETRVAN